MARLFEPWRLFFPSALLLAPLNVLAWLAVRQGIVDWPAASASWHGREMVFGYSFAVIAGYLLPAFPLRRVVGLWLLWLLGRLACIVPPGTLLPWLQLAASAAFPATVAILGFRRFHAAKRARNLAFPMIMLVLGAAGVATYAAEVGWLPMPAQNPAVLSVYVVSLLVMVMGGRAVPTATVGSLRAQGRVLRVVPRPRLEAAGIFGMLSLLVLDMLGLGLAAGLAALAVAVVLALQMVRWHSLSVLGDPETWPLHLGFFWLGLGLTLIGLQRLGFILPPDAGALHALAAGGIGTVTLVMLLRVARQRSGILPASPTLLQALQLALVVAVTLRVGGGWVLPGHRELVLWLAGMAWLVAFGLGTAVLVPAALRAAR